MVDKDIQEKPSADASQTLVLLATVGVLVALFVGFFLVPLMSGNAGKPENEGGIDSIGFLPPFVLFFFLSLWTGYKVGFKSKYPTFEDLPNIPMAILFVGSFVTACIATVVFTYTLIAVFS